MWAHNVVTPSSRGWVSYYINRADQFPVDLRLYLQFRQEKWAQFLMELSAQLRTQATLDGYRCQLLGLLRYRQRERMFRTKTQLAAELVQQAVTWELPFEVVLFDSWFCRWPLVQTVQALDKDWVSGCPKDRNLLFNNRWTQLQAFISSIPTEAYRPLKINGRLYWTFSKVLPMKALWRQRVRIVATYADQIRLDKTPSFYASNRRDWEAKRMLTTYLDRWPPETFNEDVKGHLGFEDYQLRKLQAIKRHWYLSFVAYSLLGDQ